MLSGCYASYPVGPWAETLKSRRGHSRLRVENTFRVFLRLLVVAVLSVGLTVLVERNCNAFDTIGEAAIPILSSPAPSIGAGLAIWLAVDFLVSFLFLLGTWFLWAQGRNRAREIDNAMPDASWYRGAGVVAVAMICALPPSYYVVKAASKFHVGLDYTPAEMLEYFVLSDAICAIALCGIAAIGRFWPYTDIHSPDSPP